MTSPPLAAVSIIIVSHRSASTLANCLRSVLAGQGVDEVVVVDNASDDASVDLACSIAAEDTRVRVLTNPDNRGFGSACNQGAACARGDWLVFLNPDAMLAPTAFASLRDHLAMAAFGLLGARVVGGDEAPCGPQRRREPTPWRWAMSASGLDRWQARWPCLAGMELPAGNSSAVVQEVDAVNGAMMAVSRDAFEAVHGFDPGFFLHAEDLDLCRRIRDAGYRVVRADDIVVRHIGGVSSRQRPVWIECQKVRAMRRYFRKHRPQDGWLARALIALGLAGVLVVRLPTAVWRSWTPAGRNSGAQ